MALTKLVTGAPVFLAHGPLLLLSAVLLQTGIVLIGLGLLAELLTRIYMDGRQRRIYTVAQPRRKVQLAIGDASPHRRRIHSRASKGPGPLEQ